jgi:hypothetical protein
MQHAKRGKMSFSKDMPMGYVGLDTYRSAVTPAVSDKIRVSLAFTSANTYPAEYNPTPIGEIMYAEIESEYLIKSIPVQIGALALNELQPAVA